MYLILIGIINNVIICIKILFIKKVGFFKQYEPIIFFKKMEFLLKLFVK